VGVPLANQPRGTQRNRAIRREDEDALTQAIIQLASQHGRYGYRGSKAAGIPPRHGNRLMDDIHERVHSNPKEAGANVHPIKRGGAVRLEVASTRFLNGNEAAACLGSMTTTERLEIQEQ
jgi:hypothetical protein